MADVSGDENFRLKLTAFADGELDPRLTLEVLDYLIINPDELRWVRDQQRLTLAARQALGGPTSGAPAWLRERIAAMTQAPGNAISGSNDLISIGRRPRRGWFTFATAAAVLLLVGIFLGRRWTPRDARPVVVAPNESSAPVIPAALVVHASRVHADCSRVAALHTAGFPKSQGVLAESVERDLHGSAPYPDLRPIGFRYVGAGPCADPLKDTIHLLYRSMKPGSPAAVSLFVQSYNEQFDLKTGTVYTVSGNRSAFPMVVWRTDRVVYFLLADDEKTEEKALALIQGSISTTAAQTLPGKS
jgi:hypothetical protein